jgi:F-type H+-transporting ATPase subunit epsilon
MYVTISKVHENLFSGDALSVSADTTEGRIGIYPQHQSFVANLKPGTVSVQTADGEKTFEAREGVLEVSNNQVTLLL